MIHYTSFRRRIAKCIPFVIFIFPCLVLCLIVRIIHLGTKPIQSATLTKPCLGLFAIFYFILRPLSSVNDNLLRDEKLNSLIVIGSIFYSYMSFVLKILELIEAALKIDGEGSAIQNFLKNRIETFDIKISI